MTVKTVVNYTGEEIIDTIKTLKFLSDIISEETTTAEMKTTAEQAFNYIAKLLCLDEKGEAALAYEGW